VKAVIFVIVGQSNITGEDSFARAFFSVTSALVGVEVRLAFAAAIASYFPVVGVVLRKTDAAFAVADVTTDDVNTIF
jgi:hypothetical protein